MQVHTQQQQQHGLGNHQQQFSDDADRTNRFLGTQQHSTDVGGGNGTPPPLRERAASQPPRASSASGVMSPIPSVHGAPISGIGASAGAGTAGTRWSVAPRATTGLNTMPGMPQSVPTRTASLGFSASPQTGSGFPTRRDQRPFPSTREDDEHEETYTDFDVYEYEDRFGTAPQPRGRSYAVDITRSRSQSLATTRQPPIGSPFTSSGAPWGIGRDTGGGSNPLSIPGRFDMQPHTFKPPGASRYNSFGAGPGPGLAAAHAAAARGGLQARPDDISNISPFVRDVSQILLDDGSAFRELWSGMPRDRGAVGAGERDELHHQGGASGTTSRRHSVSVVQPRREIVGFNVSPERDFSEERAPPTGAFHRTPGAFGRGGLLLTDDDLAADLGILHLNDNGSSFGSGGPRHHNRQRSGEGGGRSLGRSPPGPNADRLTGFQPLNLNIPAGAGAFARPGQLGSPTEGANNSPSSARFADRDQEAPYLGGGAGRAAAQALGARYVPGHGIQYPQQQHQGGIDALASPSFRTSFAAQDLPSPTGMQPSLSGRGGQPGGQFGAVHAPPMMARRSSDAAGTQSLENVGRGVPLSAVPPSMPLYIVEFKAGRTDLYYCTHLTLRVGDLVIVEADRGKDLGKIVNDTITLDEVEAFQKQQQAKIGWSGDGSSAPQPGTKEISPKMIYGKANSHDLQGLVAKAQDELKALKLCQSKVCQKKLPMEVIDAEYQWDRRKLTFYFIAEKRIDFRELVRELFRLYKTRIWMASLQGPNPGAYEQ